MLFVSKTIYIMVGHKILVQPNEGKVMVMLSAVPYVSMFPLVPFEYLKVVEMRINTTQHQDFNDENMPVNILASFTSNLYVDRRYKDARLQNLVTVTVIII